MRCKYCGSSAIHPAKQHKNFSTGKAVAGTVTFGIVGAAAGFIGKDVDGYQCSACGQFMDSPMDYSLEMQINSAISEAESGGPHYMFDYYKKQYINIQANIPQVSSKNNSVTYVSEIESKETPISISNEKIKHSYKNNLWQPDSPVQINTIVIKTINNNDYLCLDGVNVSENNLRSVYFKAQITDDTGDVINEKHIVYQNMNLAPGSSLPGEQTFSLDTDIAYAVKLLYEKAAFEDGSVIRAEKEPIVLSQQPELTSENFARVKYVHKYVSKISNLSADSKLFLPIVHDNYWQCICGHVAEGKENCPYCKASLSNVEQLISQKNLKLVQEKDVKSRAAFRANETASLFKLASEMDKEAFVNLVQKSINNNDSFSNVYSEYEKEKEKELEAKKKAKEQWKIKSQKTIQLRNDRFKKDLQDFEEKIKADALQWKIDSESELKNTITKDNELIDSNQKELDHLGFMQISQKSKLKKQIEFLKNQINETQSKLNNLPDEYNNKLNSIPDEIEKFKKEEKENLKKIYPLQDDPDGEEFITDSGEFYKLNV